MKKRIITIMAALMMLAGSATAQVFYMAEEDELNMRGGSGGSGDDGIVFYTLDQDVQYDQMAPLGEGILLLSGLAGFYLLRRRK